MAASNWKRAMSADQFCVIAGRQAWSSVTDPIGVATDARLPWLGVGVLSATALAAGVTLASLISLRPSHGTIAAALRTE